MNSQARDHDPSEDMQRSPEPTPDYYRDAVSRGTCLVLKARLADLQRIFAWQSEVPALRHLPSKQAKLLATALYEACANIVEHGYGSDGSRQFELWWVPRDEGPSSTSHLQSKSESAVAAVQHGYFLLRDHGAAFLPSGWKRADFHDARVRRKGRGLGLDIMHGVMQEIQYFPATRDGNLTVMLFGLDTNGSQKPDTKEDTDA